MNPFDVVLLESIDEALSSLGDSIKKTTYFYLERSFHMKREEIPDRIGAFTQVIENIFGIGACLIEVVIMKKLYEKVGGVFDEKEFKKFGLVEYVTKAKWSFKEKNPVETVVGLGDWEDVEVETRKPKIWAG